MKYKTSHDPAIILLAEDNPADQMLTKRVLDNAQVKNKLYIVEDGIDAMNYLNRKENYIDSSLSPRPDLILLDINMPRMDGKQVLQKIKTDPLLKIIPVVMLTTSDHEKDIIESYKLGVNSYIAKPVDMDQFIKVMQGLERFWLTTVELPPKGE